MCYVILCPVLCCVVLCFFVLFGLLRFGWCFFFSQALECDSSVRVYAIVCLRSYVCVFFLSVFIVLVTCDGFRLV